MTKSKKPPKRRAIAQRSSTNIPSTTGPVTLEEARAIAQAQDLKRAPRRRGRMLGRTPDATLASVAAERNRLDLKNRQEIDRRIREYKAVFTIMEERGIKGIQTEAAVTRRRGRRAGLRHAPAATALAPLQILAEGDSWFSYPVPLFGGGVIPRLEKKLGVPILNLATAGDEVRFMLGVKERRLLAEQFQDGGPAGKPWDVLLFSGGGNDIVDNPMALWIRDFDPMLPLPKHIQQDRFDAALEIVRAGYEDLIRLRDQLTPTTRLIFHAYDFAIPDGRGICNLGPWLKPTFDLRNFPTLDSRYEVTKAMLMQFAAMLTGLEGANAKVTFLNGQGTLPKDPASWHNELHPSKVGFTTFAELFRQKLKQLFPGRVL